MLGKPHIRQNNLKTSLRFPCLGLNAIKDSISPENRMVWFINAVMHLKDAEEIASSVGPDQTAPLGAV